MAVSGTGFAYVSSTNPYVPSNNYSASVTANLVIGYSRQPKKFRINNYTKIIPVAKPQGYFTRISIGQQGKIQYPDLRDWLWNPGQGRPRGNWNQLGFQFFPYNTIRRSFSTTLDQKTIDVASFQLQAMHVAMCAQQAMTARTQFAVTQFTNPANWYGTHAGFATQLAGGLWSAGTSTNHYIQDSLYKMAIQIELDTFGVVTPDQLSIVLNPNTARAAASSQEIRNFLANQVDAIKYLQGVLPTPQDMYNLPKNLFGFPIEIENAVLNAQPSSPNDQIGTTALYNQFIMPDGQVCMLGRSGDLVGSEGTTDYTTVQFFMYEEMSAESFTNNEDRLILNAVTEDYDCQVVAPASGYLLQQCI